ILAKERNKRQSPLDRAANPLPDSPVSLACGDVVPHIVVQSPRPRLGKFETHAAKRLLQHYRRKADVGETRTFGSPSALMGYARQAVVAVERRCDYQLTMSNDRT